jgi:hypothetical protein
MNAFLSFHFKVGFMTLRMKGLQPGLGARRRENALRFIKMIFFEFKFKSLQRSSDLFSSLNKQRALLTPDSLMQTDFNFFQPSFLLKDRCGVEYQVAKNTNIFSPDVSSSTLTSISVWSFLIINDGVNPPRYVTDYLISGIFSTQVLIGNESVSIGGSYSLLFVVEEPL